MRTFPACALSLPFIILIRSTLFLMSPQRARAFGWTTSVPALETPAATPTPNDLTVNCTCGVRVGNVLESLRTRIARSFSAQDNNGDSNVVVQVLPATAVQPLVSERPKQTQVVMAVDHTVRRVLEEF